MRHGLRGKKYMSFKKGDIPWMKGKHHTKESREKLRKSHLGQIAWNKGKVGVQVAYNKGKKLSKAIRLNMSLAKIGKKQIRTEEGKKAFAKKVSGENHYNYKGNNVGYSGAHHWLKNKFGRANKCENKENKVLNFICKDISKKFEWAKKKGSKYTRNNEDYYQLCQGCHRKYDTIKYLEEAVVTE